VPENTIKVSTTNIKLLNKKAVSRDRYASKMFLVANVLSLKITKPMHAKKVNKINVRNKLPTGDSAKAWTDEMIPLLVKNVAKKTDRNVKIIRSIFHTFIPPFPSCIITECKNAEDRSHGINEAFSIGSQAQYPPHPSTWYDHHPPKKIPTPKNNHEKSVHFLIWYIQSLFLVQRPAMAKANGTAKPA
jgi:hypothetical protein